MLKCLFPMNFNIKFFLKPKTKQNTCVEKKENKNIYKKLLDKNTNTYMNLVKDNINWFNNKMEKNYVKYLFKNSLFLYGNEKSILEPKISEIYTPNDIQENKCEMNAFKCKKDYNMKYGPVLLQYTTSSFYGMTSVIISVGFIYYLTR